MGVKVVEIKVLDHGYSKQKSYAKDAYLQPKAIFLLMIFSWSVH